MSTKDINEAAENCVKDIMSIEQKKQKKMAKMIDEYFRKSVAASVKRRERK